MRAMVELNTPTVDDIVAARLKEDFDTLYEMITDSHLLQDAEENANIARSVLDVIDYYSLKEDFDAFCDQYDMEVIYEWTWR